MLGMKLEGGERLEKEKKRKRLVYNPPIRTQVKPKRCEESNDMVGKKIWSSYEVAYAAEAWQHLPCAY